MTAREQLARRAAVGRVRAYWRDRVDAHLCDRALPNEKRWKAMFLRLVDDVRLVRSDIARIGEPPEEVGFDPREPLVWAWCVLDAMPNARAVQYEAMRERSTDGTGIEDRADALRHRGIPMPGIPTAIDMQVPWLAALARVLDDDLAALQYWPEDVRAWTPEDWRPPGYACFVVPVSRSYRLGDGKPAQRRALVHHAIVPERIGSLSVDLRLHPDAAPADEGVDPARWTYGAAAFPDMTVVPAFGTGRFRIVGAPVPSDERALLDGQVSDAQAASTDVLVWPELTMPDGRLDTLRARLAESPLLGGRIPLVVAGSWHVPAAAAELTATTVPGDESAAPPEGGVDAAGDGGAGPRDGATAPTDGGASPDDAATQPSGAINGTGATSTPHLNRCEVMLGDGEPLLSYDKRRPFPFDGLTEDIQPGETLPVVVMEDRLIGVAICRDNCDDNADEGYRHLPIDLIVVPSMGAESTVDAHERHAKAQRSRQGTITLVVQQRLAVAGRPRPAGASAFSFVRPEEVPRPGLDQDVPFRTLG